MVSTYSELLSPLVPLRPMTPARRKIIFQRMDAAKADYIAGKIEDGDEFEMELDRLIEAVAIDTGRWQAW